MAVRVTCTSAATEEAVRTAAPFLDDHPRRVILNRMGAS
jgi:hypothetical protein